MHELPKKRDSLKKPVLQRLCSKPKLRLKKKKHAVLRKLDGLQLKRREFFKSNSIRSKD